MRQLGQDDAESRLLARMIAGCGKGLLLDILATENEAGRTEIRAAFDRLIDSRYRLRQGDSETSE